MILFYVTYQLSIRLIYLSKSIEKLDPIDNGT